MGNACSGGREHIFESSGKSGNSRASTMIEPLASRRPGNNFLEILNNLNDDEDDDEKAKQVAKRDRALRTASSSGIEANPSDETASQTLIGREADTDADPGLIQLGLIKIQDRSAEKAAKG